jgi:hypothetical protein
MSPSEPTGSRDHLVYSINISDVSYKLLKPLFDVNYHF